MASSYWQANGIAELSLGRFQDALESGDAAGERRAFYTLASYYGRTLRILRSALERHHEPLAEAALRNLVALNRPLTQMHRSAPNSVPLALAVDRGARDDLTRDLIVRVLSETPEPLAESTIVDRTNELNLLGRIAPGTVRRHLKDLQASGHVARENGAFGRTRRTYTEFDLDAASLQALLGPHLEVGLGAAGFHGLQDVAARPVAFREEFMARAGIGESVGSALLEAATSLLDTRPPVPGAWRHVDLLNSPYPRPYQYEAFAVFRGGGYNGLLVESPTGSGKTMIGMLCIQDWLQSIRLGQSILVLVPTANYQQQWIGELCFKPVGLHLPPEAVFSGTPGQLERFQRQTGTHPAIILMTYAALAQTGSGVGKGGFDVDSIEMFLQSANVRYVALDEVHKVVEDMQSVSADVTRQLVEWLRDGSIRGLIGFSGTAESYRPRFAQLGLNLAHAIPLDVLIGYGFVAPFAEIGVGFANSARERRIRELLDAYKAHMLAWRDLLDSSRLRRLFGETSLDERVRIGRQYLGMYRGRADADVATARRLTTWEQDGAIGLAEMELITIVQIARGWSDEELARQAGVDPERTAALLTELEALRDQLADLIYLPATVARLRTQGFGTRLDVERLRRVHETARSAAARAEEIADVLATTIVGLYGSLADWYLRAGEGRVETIKALIDAERSARHVSGVIVFDAGRRIKWRSGVTAPGYEGVAGLFAQLLGDERFTAFAALSSEMYLTFSDTDPLPARIASFIQQEQMRGEVAQAIFDLCTQGLAIDAPALQALRDGYAAHVEDYVSALVDVHARRLGEFRRRILGPLRRMANKLCPRPVAERLAARMRPGNVHLEGLLTTFYDYAELVESFRHPRVAEIEQVSGAHQRFFVVPMPGGRRKQLMYDLTARIVDAESLGVNLVIVSTWARTGWNVIRPNVLIDATATRDVTAWQQLRGRAIRSLGTWTNACYRFSLVLRSGEEVDGALSPELLEAALETTEAAGSLRDRLADLTDADRETLRVALMLGRNKVTHIYEMVKAFGGMRQVEYDRKARVWRRREAIERKHAHESSVNLISGDMVQGVGHAPLVYQVDPRSDLPHELQEKIEEVIGGRDTTVVRGWLRAAER